MNHFQPQAILVTGGAGFIGANYLYYLAKHLPNSRIVNIDALTYAGKLEHLNQLNHKDYHFIHGDICDRQLIDHTLRQFNIDTIVHFAAESHVDRSILGPDAFIKTNIIGTHTLLEASRHYVSEQKRTEHNFRFHHVSTDEVFGSLKDQDPPSQESDPYQPNSPYSASKAASDHLVRAYFHTYGLACTLSHCSNNYGPFQHQEKFIPTIIRSCLENKSIPIYGDGKNTRDWLHVSDHCSAIQLIIEKSRPGEGFNIGANNELSNLALVHFVCKQIDIIQQRLEPSSSLMKFVTDRPGHDWRYALNAKKIQQLGWKPKVSFLEGIQQTIAYFLQEK